MTRDVSLFTAIVAIVTTLPALFALSLIPAALFLCFDDMLAEATGEAWIGAIGFWRAYAMLFVLSSIFKTTVTGGSKK